MHECWCSHCGAGQMDVIHDIFFNDRISDRELIGKEIKCSHCGKTNVIEDVINIIPSTFLISSDQEYSKVKANEDLAKWMQQ